MHFDNPLYYNRLSFPFPFPFPFPISSEEVKMNTFEHERLDSYQVAIKFVALGNTVVETLPH